MKKKINRRQLKNSSTQKINQRVLHNTPQKPAATDAVIRLSSELNSSTDNDGLTKLSFVGYSGNAVDLSDYGYEAKVVYSIAGISNKAKTPILEEHWYPIGHAESITKTESNLSGEGVASYPSEHRERVVGALKNGFPYQASMGLLIPNEDVIEYFGPKEKVTVNNRSFEGPIYVVHKAFLKEMTVTISGRDSDTDFQTLSERTTTMLLNSKSRKVKNSTPEETLAGPTGTLGATGPIGTPGVQGANGNVGPSGSPAPVTDSVPTPAPIEAPSVVSNSVKKWVGLLNSHPDHRQYIEAHMEAGTSFEVVENSVKLKVAQNGLPRVPGNPNGTEQVLENTDLFVRVALSMGITPERLSKHSEKKIVDKYYNKPQMSFVECLTELANNNQPQRRFTGFSDIDILCHSLKQTNLRSAQNILNMGPSTVDMPNVFQKVTTLMMEERWELNPPFITKYLQEESNKDFRKTQKIRVSGGEEWQPVGRSGKLEATEFGDEKMYETKLQTIGQYVVWTREDVYNDDMNAIAALLAAMVEGAMIYPDKKWGQLALVKPSAANGFWVNAVNSFTGLPLNRTNLKTVFNSVRQYDEDRGTPINTMINDRFMLITSVNNEEAGFEILEQERIVNDTTANTKTGEKNFMYKKMDHDLYPQMSNIGLLNKGVASTFVSDNTWLVMPKSKKYSPWTIVFLRGMKTPVLEPMDLPGNILGYGHRGFWDVEINERENIAVARANG